MSYWFSEIIIPETNEINLYDLARYFPISDTFTRVEYYGKDGSFNDPPIGPIPEGFCCIFCKQKGPKNHKKNCTNPTLSSLYKSCKKEGKSYAEINNKSATGKFKNNVHIEYTYPTGEKVTFRVYNNGKIVKTMDKLNGTDNTAELIDIINDIDEEHDIMEEEYAIEEKRITLIRTIFRLTNQKIDFVFLFC